MPHTVLISDSVFALLANLIVENLRQNGVQEEVEIMRGCPENKGCKAASFIIKDSGELLCCLRYVLQYPNTNLRDDVMQFVTGPYLNERYPLAAKKLLELTSPLKFGLEPTVSGRQSWD